MTTPSVLLLGLAVLSAIAAIAADLRGRVTMARIFRPAAMIAIIVLASVRPPTSPESYRMFILAGLAASFVGDIFMMLRNKRFTAGLIAFLAAQILYVSAFLRTMTARIEISIALPLLIYALFMMRTLFPHLGPLKAPVALYILVITVMAGLAAHRYIEAGGTPALFAFLGAIFFVISDTILAINRFVRKVRSAQLFILGTYFAAQIFFALSV